MSKSIIDGAEVKNRKGLEATDIVAGYRDMKILRGVSAGAKSGEIVTIIGPNGAGKSTFFKVLCGLLRAREGRVLLDGRDITMVSPTERLNLGLAYVPQAQGTFTNMTVAENLDMGAFIRKDNYSATLDKVISYFPMLKERWNQPTGTMSGGEQHMVAIARALMGEPSAILLDEPSAGLSPPITDSLFSRIEEIAASGVAIMIVEQNAKKALQIANRAYVLSEGKNRMEGKAEALLNDPQLRTLYLGEVSDSKEE
jgi:branched-chain amino acid transport system ATP-binding protein